MASKLHPIHPSVKLTVLGKVRPHNMERLSSSWAHTEFLERTALSIFTDMVNAGQSFQSALGAIYLSGIENAMSLMKEDTT